MPANPPTWMIRSSKLAQLSHVEFFMLGGDRIIVHLVGNISEMPVDCGIVNAEGHVMARASLRETLHNIFAVRRGVHHVERGRLSMKETEAVVMFRGEHNEAHTGVLREPGNRIGIPTIRFELARKSGVLRFGNVRVRLNLLAVVA